ncbi:MAG: GTPase, partial [archaeon]
MRYPQLFKSKELIDIVIKQLKKDPETNNNIFKYVDEFQHKITERYEKIVGQLPDYENMEPYYLMMSKNIISQGTMEKHKNHYRVTITVINQISEKYKKQIRIQRQLSDKIKLQREYLGRVISAIKKLDKTTDILFTYAEEFKRIPNPRKLFTIVLVGVPNTGKTTFLTQLTDADPEINSYAFTTKSLNFGYFKKREEIIQVIDTPGLIHSEFKDRNIIEKQAIVA